MSLVHQARFAAIDFESAGAARGKTDSPIQIGMATWSLSAGHGEPFCSYLFTAQPIQWSARKIHGIGPADLATAPALVTLWPEVKARLQGAIVVAHGKGTEKRFLRSFPGHGFGPWLDTLLLARAVWPSLADHSLGALCRHHGLASTITEIVPRKSWHDALFDAVASLVLLAHVIESLQLAQTPLDALLHPDTSIWHQSKRA